MLIDFSPLVEAYGRMPSFHDGHVLDVVWGTTLKVTAYVYEPPEEGCWKQEWDSDLHTLVTLEFGGVEEASLFFTDNWLSRAEFREEDGRVVAELQDAESGRTGRIVSGSVRVSSLVRPDAAFEIGGEKIGTVNVRFEPRR
ncbi:hypothetical protein EON81_18765 [bacterium]|nr:MAG: hypothetical protein EON81_18765 [bacterium]